MNFQTRRHFLKFAAQGVGGIAAASSLSTLSACATFDRVITGEGVDDPKRVVVIGAGLAGLSACYELKKNGIPFALFEASARLGGRVFSLSEFNSASQIGELGGEWVWPGQELIFQIARELKLELTERRLTPNQMYWEDTDKRTFLMEMRKFETSLQKKKLEVFGRGYLRLTPSNVDELKMAADLDRTSVPEFLQEQKVANDLRNPIIRAMESHYGLPAKKISSLHLLYFFTQPQSPLHPSAQQAWRFALGSGALSQAIYDRIAGVIPGRAVRFQHQLVGIDRQEKSYELKFQTPNGVQTFLSSRVISTVPLHLMKQVTGFYKLGFAEDVVKAANNFEAGALAKATLSFGDRPWTKSLSVDRGQFAKGMQFWETEPRGTGAVLTPKSLLSVQWGAEAAEKAGLHSIDEVVKELNGAKIGSGFEQKSQVMNWSRHKWSEGGRTMVSLGGHRWVGGLMGTPDNSWILAGDFASVVWSGTMNGAVESGFMAATKMRSQLSATT